MARTRRSLDERIEKQEQVVSKAKEHYEAELNKLEQLMQKRNEQKKKELLKAVEESNKSIDEIIELIRQASASAGDDDIES